MFNKQSHRVSTAIAPLVLETTREIDANGKLLLLQAIEDLKNKHNFNQKNQLLSQVI